MDDVRTDLVEIMSLMKGRVEQELPRIPRAKQRWRRRTVADSRRRAAIRRTPEGAAAAAWYERETRPGTQLTDPTSASLSSP